MSNVKLGSKVTHTRRNGEEVVGKIIDEKTGERGVFFLLSWKDADGKVRTLWARPSEFRRV